MTAVTLTHLRSLTDGENILALLLYNKEKHNDQDSSGIDFHSQLQQKQCAERPLLHRPETSGYEELNVNSFRGRKMRVRYNEPSAHCRYFLLPETSIYNHFKGSNKNKAKTTAYIY